MSNLIIDKEKIKLFVALVEPDIPQNTGNIARLCAATATKLVLVRPLGFRLTDKSFTRAGMDYWHKLDPIIFSDLNEFIQWGNDKRFICLSAHASENYASFKYKENDVLVFGSESRGLPQEIKDLASKNNTLLRLPMVEDARCINVSSSASAVTYEALKQLHKW